MMTYQLRYKAAQGFAIVALALLTPAIQASDASATLDGTWKINRQQSSFTPTDGPIPFTAEAKQTYEQNKAALAKGDYSFDHTQSRCASPGVPRLALTPEPFHLWVRPRAVAFQYRWNQMLRTVDMTGRQIEEPFAGPAIGISQGHWEGKTLVIKGQYFSQNTLIDDLVPHDDAMVVEERWSLRDADTLVNQMTISNPGYFTRPWHTEVIYSRQPNKGFTENVCLDRLEAGQRPLPLLSSDQRVK